MPYKNKEPDIAQKLNDLMDAHGVTPTHIANTTNLNQSTIHRISKGESESPRLGNLIEIADYFGMPVSALVAEPKKERSSLQQLIVDKVDSVEAIKPAVAKILVQILALGE